jgi:hypothetical protein
MTVTTVGQSLWRKENVWIAVGKKGRAVVVQAAYMIWILIRVILIIHLYTDECYKYTFFHVCSLGTIKCRGEHFCLSLFSISISSFGNEQEGKKISYP